METAEAADLAEAEDPTEVGGMTEVLDPDVRKKRERLPAIR